MNFNDINWAAKAVAAAQIAAACTAGAAVIHLAVSSEHFAKWWLYGTFFLVAALVQGALALGTWMTRSARLLWGSAVVNALTVLLWTVTRTTGLPFGPDAGQPEAFGITDILCAALEVAGVAAAVTAVILQRRAMTVPGTTPISTVGRAKPAGALVIAAALAVLGASGVAVAAPGGSAGTNNASSGMTDMGSVGSGNGGAAKGGSAHGNGNRMDMSDLPDVSNASAQQTAAARTLLTQLEADTAKYQDPATAAKDGFDIKAALAGWQKKHPNKTLGAIPALHVANKANRTDGRLVDPAAPETVIYHRAKDGTLTLIGVMFTAEKKAPPAVYQPYLRWHFHTPCVAAGGRKLKPVGGEHSDHPSCPAGSTLRKTGYMTHVWFVSPDQLRYAFAMTAPMAQLRSAATGS